MSDKDLIRRGNIADKAFTILKMLTEGERQGKIDRVLFSLLYHDIGAMAFISAVPQSMSAVEYIKQQDRMCMTQSDGAKCEGCPLSPSVTGEYCDTYVGLHPEKAVAILEKWAQEHPEEDSDE